MVIQDHDAFLLWLYLSLMLLWVTERMHFTSLLYPDQKPLEVCNNFLLTVPLQQLAVSSVSPYCPSFQPWWNPCVTLIRGCVTTATWFGGWGNRIRMCWDGEMEPLSLSKGFAFPARIGLRDAWLQSSFCSSRSFTLWLLHNESAMKPAA